MSGMIAEPAGLRVLSSLIDLINNKGEVEKIIKSINRARDEANTAIEVVGTIKQIDTLSLEALEDRAAAKEVLERAGIKANGIIAKADAEAVSMLEGSQNTLNALDTRHSALEDRARNVTAREDELQKMMGKAERLHKKAEKLQVDADALMAKANEQLVIFRNAAGRIQ